MNTNIITQLLTAAFFCTFLVACEPEKSQAKSQFKDITEQAVTHYIADYIYEPSIIAVQDNALILNNEIIELCRAGNDKDRMKYFLLSREQWKKAILSWRESRAYQIAPIKSLFVYRQVDQLPMNTIIVDAVLKKPTLHPGNEERSIYGYATIEYLLFFNGDENEAFQKLKDENVCHFLENTAHDLSKNISKIKKYWLELPDGAKAQFTEVKGKFYLDQKEVTTNVVAQMLNSLEMLIWNKIGLPANFFRGEPDPKKLDAWRSQYSLNNIKAIINGIEKVYGDTNSLGIYHLIYAKDKSLANSIKEHFEHINHLLDELTSPIEVNLNNPPDEFEEVFHELQEVQNEITDMAKILELKLVFEEDGD